MKTLLFLLLPLFAHAQMPEIKIGRCAGKDPILLWGGGGPDFGEFTLIVGEGPCDGIYFDVNHGMSTTISRVTTWDTVRAIPEDCRSKPNNFKEGLVSTIGTFHGLKRGDVIQVRYLIERKKEPRT